MNNVKSTITEQDIPYKLPKNWTWYYWGDIIQEYQQGLIRTNRQLGNEGVEYFKMNNIIEDGTYNFNNLPRTKATEKECEIYFVKNGDFFINVRNSRELVGKSCVIGNVDRTILFNHMLVRISHKDYIAGEFINAFLNIPSSKKMIERCKQGTTTVIALYQNDLYKVPIAIPDIGTHNKIVSLYKSISNKIELNNKINKELENFAQTIYEYWFVQNAEKSWEQKKIGELIQNQKNGDWGKETKQVNYTEKVICIRGTDINSLIGNSELKAPERYILEKNKNKFLTDGDFVIEISGGSPTQSTGRIAYILDEMLNGFENPLICSNFCKAISLKDKNLFYYFLFVWKQLYDNGLFFGYEGKTSGIKNFLFDDFVNSYEIIIPPTQLLGKFNIIVSPIFTQIIKNRQENVELTKLRDFLLPLLMNGQVTVGKTQNEPKIIPLNKSTDNNTKYQIWKTQIGLAARGNIDEQTLRNIYEAIDENDR